MRSSFSYLRNRKKEGFQVEKGVCVVRGVHLFVPYAAHATSQPPAYAYILVAALKSGGGEKGGRVESSVS